MADSAGGNSTADAKKKATALDEDFGKDFLSFWGSSKKGKDKIDFDMDEVTRNTKKSFNFDKLDDFELGGDFDKLPSFKVDMPDLDFSSPGMNNDKSTEKHIGKKDSRKENFSFNFDFNELDKFDLDPSPVEINKKPSKHADGNTSDYSYKHVPNEDSRSKSDTSADVSNDLDNTKQLNKDSKGTPRPESLTLGTIIKDIRSSISQDLEHHDTSHEVQTSTAKEIVVTDANKNDTHGNEGCKEPTQETGFIRTNVEKTNQDCMLQSISANCFAQEGNPQIRIRPASSDALKTDPVRAEDGSTRTVDSSKSRNGSPINSYNTRCDPDTSLVKSSNSSGDSQKHCNSNQNEVTSGKDVRNHSIQCQMGIQNASFTDCPQTIASRMMNNGDRKNSGSKFIISPLQRGSAAVNPKSLNDKLASALQLNSLRVSAENASRRTLSPTKRRQDFVYNNKLESLNICPANDSIESNENQDQAETWKVSISKSSGEGSIKCISQRDDDQSDTSRFQVDHSDLQQSPTATNSARLAHNFLSSTASMKCLKIAPVEISGAFLKDKTNCDNRLTISSLKKLDSDSPNSATLKAAKSVRFSERRLEFPLKMASKTAHSVLTEKSGPTDLLLKMKTVEESTADPENINPVKPSIESVIVRNPLEVAQKVERMTVPEPENLQVDRNVVNCTDVLALISVANLKSKTMEVPLLTNKDGQVEKTMVLDDTCFENDSMRTVDSSQSRNTSPDNSLYSRCNQELSVVKVINADEGFQEHQGNQNEVTQGKYALSEPDQYQMETPDASFTEVSKKIVHRVKNSSGSENQNAHTVVTPSSLQSSAKAVKSMTMKEKVIAAIQSKSFSISAENVPLKSSAATQKEPSLDARKLEALNISPVNESRFSKQTPEQTRTQKVDILKLYEQGSTKGITAISRGQDRDTLRSSLQLQTIGSNSAKCIIPNLAFGIASMKSLEILPIEVNGSSLEHMTFDSRLTTSITKLKGKAQNNGRSKEAKSRRFPESNSEFPLNTAWMANITVKSASLATPLKRKILEDSTNDPKNSTPLKRLMESTIGRKPFEVSPKTESTVVPITENLEASHDDGCAENLNSNGVTESGGLSVGLEVLAPLEKDEIVEKAEAYSKELDDMCGMLRKKHEEARELLVRAVVNNNTLHMLKNSLLDEKIHSLQKFATCLSEKF